MIEGLLSRLLSALGYRGDPGYIGVDGITRLEAGYRHPVEHAMRAARVVGVFCIEQASTAGSLLPIAYVATAQDRADALEIHSAIWSQSLVPFLLIVTAEGVWSCDAFLPPSHHSSRAIIAAEELAEGRPPPSAIGHLSSLELRVSLGRPPGRVAGTARIDERLLSNLRGLAGRLTSPEGAGPGMPAGVANALIGRLLLLRFLRDRKALPSHWLPDAPTGQRGAAWLGQFWERIATVETAFNGSLFPMSAEERRRIAPARVQMAFSVVIEDAEIAGGGLQFGFKEFRFESLRTETLSAVYELFLELSDPDQKTKDGAVYTPPHLADHVLSKIATVRPFREGDRAFDCAMGSGVFLVGAFRRLLEDALPDDRRKLSLARVHAIARRSLWGIEKNHEACHVAALSIYLSMLEYADPEDVNRAIARPGRGRKVFPPMVGRNLVQGDFFDDDVQRAFPRKFSHIVANPPWTTITAAGPLVAEYTAGAERRFTDGERAAPAFMHKAVERHLRGDGAFGFVMSARAVVSSSARNFPAWLLEGTELTTCSNLANLRRKLFMGAEHAAIVLVGRPPGDHHSERVDVFVPSQATQPVARDGRHWVLVEDRAECRTFRRGLLASPEDLIDALMLSPADLRFRAWMNATRRSGVLVRLDDALDILGLAFTGGGDENETGVDGRYILGSNRKKPNFWKDALTGRTLLDKPYELPEGQIKAAGTSFQRMFSGNVVLFSRGTGEALFVERPIAFNSSLCAIHARDGGPSAAALRFMAWVAEYLNSDFARYCMSVVGRDWAIDNRRIEKRQLLAIPLAPDRRGLIPGLARPGGSPLASPPDFIGALSREFRDFRSKLQNGKRPPEAAKGATPGQRSQYETALGSELDRFSGGGANWRVRTRVPSARAFGVVLAALEDHGEPIALEPADDEARFASALDAFIHSSANLASESSWLTRGEGVVALVKSMGRPHWTVDRAFADAALIVADALSAAEHKAEGPATT